MPAACGKCGYPIYPVCQCAAIASDVEKRRRLKVEEEKKKVVEERK